MKIISFVICLLVIAPFSLHADGEAAPNTPEVVAGTDSAQSENGNDSETKKAPTEEEEPDCD